MAWWAMAWWMRGPNGRQDNLRFVLESRCCGHRHVHFIGSQDREPRSIRRHDLANLFQQLLRGPAPHRRLVRPVPPPLLFQAIVVVQRTILTIAPNQRLGSVLRPVPLHVTKGLMRNLVLAAAMAKQESMQKKRQSLSLQPLPFFIRLLQTLFTIECILQQDGLQKRLASAFLVKHSSRARLNLPLGQRVVHPPPARLAQHRQGFWTKHLLWTVTIEKRFSIRMFGFAAVLVFGGWVQRVPKHASDQSCVIGIAPVRHLFFGCPKQADGPEKQKDKMVAFVQSKSLK